MVKYNNDLSSTLPDARSGTQASDTWRQHLYTGEQSVNTENWIRQSPDERQARHDAGDDMYIRDVLDSMRAKYSVPLPRPRVDPDIFQSLNEDVAGNKYGRDMAFWDYNLNKDKQVTNTELASKAHSAYWNFDLAPDFYAKNVDQYNAAGAFLVDTFKRARTVGYPIHPLSPILNGLPSTAFTGQAK